MFTILENGGQKLLSNLSVFSFRIIIEKLLPEKFHGFFFLIQNFKVSKIVFKVQSISMN